MTASYSSANNTSSSLGLDASTNARGRIEPYIKLLAEIYAFNFHIQVALIEGLTCKSREG